MDRYFLDSSALIKRYHPEVGSDRVQKLFDTPTNRLIISRLAILELHSGIARLVRERHVTAVECAEILRRLHGDIGTGSLTVAALSDRRVNQAAELLSTIGLERPIRTLDAIQLATAQAIHRRGSLTAFVAGDKHLLSAVTACGMLALDVA